MGKFCCMESDDGGGLDLTGVVMVLVIALALMAVCFAQPRPTSYTVCRYRCHDQSNPVHIKQFQVNLTLSHRIPPFLSFLFPSFVNKDIKNTGRSEEAAFSMGKFCCMEPDDGGLGLDVTKVLLMVLVMALALMVLCIPRRRPGVYAVYRCRW
ncbi:hypothetical protein DITRI_Ditri15bG0116100 [Diplodiscus trichospermus]